MKSNSPLTCGIAFALIGGMIWIVITTNSSNFTKENINLTSDQMIVFERIKKRRFQIWTKGLLLGFLVALIAAKFLPINGENMSACAVSAIAMGVNYFYYMLSPKEEEMISYLRPEQIQGWTNVRKTMSRKYQIGMILGIVGSFLLAKGLNTN